MAIAEGTKNDHASVIKLVRAYQEDLCEFAPSGLIRFEIRPRQEGQHGDGETGYAILNEDQALLLFTYMRNTGIVRQFKKSLVKAFCFLVNKLNSPRDPLETLNDPAALRGALLAYTEKVLTLESQVGELNEALDRIATADGATCSTGAAKALQMRPKDLFAWMQAHEWIHRRVGGSGWLAYQLRIQQWLLEHQVTNVRRGGRNRKGR